MKAPSWITSAGALVALVLSAAGYIRKDGAQEQAQLHSDERATRTTAQLDRLWDAQQQIRSEVTTSLRREIDLACACCQR